MPNQPNEERLQKALARAGIASRRASEDLIAAGRVKVNGKIVTQLGTKIDPARDRITVDDEPVGVRASAQPQKTYIMLNKPQGYLSTVTDPQGRPTVLDLVEAARPEGRSGRLYPVGRLDMDTEGLLLLTNDGLFAQTLSHPSFGVEKEYLALLDGIVAMKDLEALRRGVSIPVEDPQTGERTAYTARPVRVDLVRHEGSNSLVKFVLKEGKKRQIRLMAEAVDHPVIELKRVRFGPLRLGDLGNGKWRNLSREEVHALVESARQRAANTTERRPEPVRPAPADNRPAQLGPQGPARRPVRNVEDAAGRPASRRQGPPPFRAPDERSDRRRVGSGRGPATRRGGPNRTDSRP